MSDQKLTKRESGLLTVFRERYVERGWAYSGCVPANDTVLHPYAGDGDELWAAIDHLIQLGFLQRRNCQALAFELSPAQRLELIEDGDLSDYWRLAGQGPGADEYAEILHVRAEVAKQGGTDV